jgi:hypothetical protein
VISMVATKRGERAPNPAARTRTLSDPHRIQLPQPRPWARSRRAPTVALRSPT